MGRLLDSGIQDTWLQSELQAIMTCGEAERTYCRSAAQRGIDPYAATPPVEAQLLAAASSIRLELLNELLALSSVSSLTADTVTLGPATSAIADYTSVLDAPVWIRRVLWAVHGAGTAC